MVALASFTPTFGKEKSTRFTLERGLACLTLFLEEKKSTSLPLMDIEISRKKNGTYLITKRIMESKQSKDIQEEISDEGVKSLFNIEFESNVSSKRLFMEQIDGL